jgi:uncharacterized membrane protein
MPRSTFAGHPLHPQMIVAPAGLLPFSLCLDLLHLRRRDPSYADGAYYAMMGGFIGGIAAGAAGAADYATIPPDSRAKKTANLHAILNLGLMGLTGLNLLLRRKRKRSPGAVPILLSVITNAGLFISAWYGGQLVYTHGMRVKPAGESPAAEIKLPGDDKLERALTGLERRLAPGDGPGERRIR